MKIPFWVGLIGLSLAMSAYAGEPKPLTAEQERLLKLMHENQGEIAIAPGLLFNSSPLLASSVRKLDDALKIGGGPEPRTYSLVQELVNKTTECVTTHGNKTADELQKCLQEAAVKYYGTVSKRLFEADDVLACNGQKYQPEEKTKEISMSLGRVRRFLKDNPQLFANFDEIYMASPDLSRLGDREERRMNADAIFMNRFAGHTPGEMQTLASLFDDVNRAPASQRRQILDILSQISPVFAVGRAVVEPMVERQLSGEALQGIKSQLYGLPMDQRVIRSMSNDVGAYLQLHSEPRKLVVTKEMLRSLKEASEKPEPKH